MTTRLLAVHRRRLVRHASWLGLAALLGLASLHPPAARATVMVDVSLDDLIVRADLVVRGKVQRIGSRVHVIDGALEARTHVWLEVKEVLGGKAEGRQLVHLWELGGRYADTETIVAGAPRYTVGEEVVVFLQRDGEGQDVYRTLEMTQGKYHVLENGAGRETMAVRDLSEIAVARWNRRGAMRVVEPPAEKAVSLDKLRTRIKALRLTEPGVKAPAVNKLGAEVVR